MKKTTVLIIFGLFMVAKTSFEIATQKDIDKQREFRNYVLSCDAVMSLDTNFAPFDTAIMKNILLGK